MNILLVAATTSEIAPLTNQLEKTWTRDHKGVFNKANIHISILITGVGMVAVTHFLTKTLGREKYDLALLLGIGGSFDRNIPLGEVVLLATDRFGDIGAEDHYNFLDIFELGLESPGKPPFSDGILRNPLSNIPQSFDLPQVSGITINTVTGTSFTANARMEKYSPQVESMEGAAFHYVCLLQEVAFAQVRSISNYVEARDKSKWKIPEAIQNLNHWAISFLEGLA